MESAARFILIANPALLQLELHDNANQPVQGGKVQIRAQWPGDPKFDTAIALNETAAGRYEGSMNFPRPGNWDMLIRVEQDGRVFEMEQKVFVSVPK
jgi:nitrogen fixation protein FixH